MICDVIFSVWEWINRVKTCSTEKHTASGALIGLRYPNEFHEQIIDPDKDLTRFALTVVYRVISGIRNSAASSFSNP